MTVSVSTIFDTIRGRLAGAPGWPAIIHRNRARLALWEDVIGDVSGTSAANLLDGDADLVDELVAHGDPVAEYRQACTVDFLFNQPLDDGAREAALERAEGSVLDALCPVDGSPQGRDLFLGGICDGLTIEGANREGVAMDAVPGVSGFRLRLSFLVTAEALGADHEAAA